MWAMELGRGWESLRDTCCEGVSERLRSLVKDTKVQRSFTVLWLVPEYGSCPNA